MNQNNILSFYSEIQQLLKGEIPRPRFADLHTSNMCNHNCIGCAYRSSLNNRVMSKFQHEKIIKDLLKLGVKGFDFAGGGDPLKLSYINWMFDLVKREGGSYGVITNGTLFNEGLISQVISQATYVRISFEASNQEDYCKYKRVGRIQWHKLMENISSLVEEKKKLGSTCEIGIKFAVGKTLRGISHYAQALCLGRQLGVDNVQFKSLRHEPEELSLEEKKIEDEICTKLCNMSINKNLQIRKWIVPLEDKHIPQCWLNPLHIVIDYLGNVYLCCYYYYRILKHKLGNMLETPIEDLWFSDKHKLMIREINREECSKVDCKFFWHHKNVERMLKSGECNFL